MVETVRGIVSGPEALVLWVAMMLPCFAVAVRDLRGPNAHLMARMKVV